MSFLEAIILGLIQGLTEFIPISSTAHLVMAAKLLRIDERLSPEQITAFNAVTQLGTLVAVLIYFAHDLRRIAVDFVVSHFEWFREKRKFSSVLESEGARLGWLIIVGTLPIVFFGLAFKEQIRGVFTKNLYVIGTAMVGLALFLMVAERIGKRVRTIENLTLRDGILVGLAQALALIPGSSRSGTTMTGCLFLGLTRETAARFSFLLSIPAVAAAGLLEFVKEFKHLDAGALMSVATATVVAGLSGYAAIAFLMRFLKTHTTHVFIAYRLVVGGLIFALLALKIVTPN